MSRRPADRPSYFQDVAARFTGLELFFDLVFAFCVSQLTRVYRDDPTWPTAVTALLIFVPVWWAWTGVSFALDRFPADDIISRFLVIGTVAGTSVMGLAIPFIPGHGEVPFVLGYAAVRLLIALFYLRARRAAPDQGRLARFYAAGFGTVGGLWLIAAIVPPLARLVICAAVMVLDVAMPQLADRRGRLLPVDRSHLADRCAAFVIIVIGESIVDTLALSSEDKFRAAIAGILVAAGVMSAAFWWGFFDRGSWQRRYAALGGDRSGQVAAVVASYLHFPLVVGIAAAAAGVQITVRAPTAAIGFPAAAAISFGCCAYLLAMNAMTLVLRVPKPESLSNQRGVLVGFLLILLALGTSWPPAAFIGATAAVLVLHAGVAQFRSRSDAQARP
jgi:low temperature requirement protein LtrA